MPGMRKLKELGSSSPEKEVPELDQVDTNIRELPDLKE